MNRPNLPRAIASLLCGNVAENPATKNISILEVLGAIQVASLPASLPPLACLFILVGGQPSKIYTTKVRIKDPQGQTILDKAFVDVPFTTQIKRANLWAPLRAFSDSTDIIKAPGRYRIELIIEEEAVGEAELEIVYIPGGASG